MKHKQEFKITPELAKQPLVNAVRQLCEISGGKAKRWIAEGKVTIDGQVLIDPRHLIRQDQLLILNLNAPKTSLANDLLADAIVYLDPHLVVVNKPAGLSTVPYEEKERNTLIDLVRALISRREKKRNSHKDPISLGIVQRLDRETSGLLVFTRNWKAKNSLGEQFREHAIHRRYYALAHGKVSHQTISTQLVENRGDGIRGSMEYIRHNWKPSGPRKHAITHVEPLEKWETATLISCRLETGRTHQIRIHLSEIGHPILGEKVYLREFSGEKMFAPRLMLHAAELGFIHPVTNKFVSWTQSLPDDMQNIVTQLRA